MAKPRFKVGEKVVIFKSGTDVPDFTGSWSSDMNKYVGKTFTVKAVGFYWKPGLPGYRFDEAPYWWDERVLKDARDLIVIYRDDMHVVALNKKTGEKGVARCNPKDEFDFFTGARIAFDRLIGSDEKKPEDVFDGIEVVCTECRPPLLSAMLGAKYFTVGKTYRLKDGLIVDDGGYAWGSGLLRKIETLNSFFDHHCDNNCCHAVFKVKQPEEQEEPKEPPRFNGKIVCVCSDFKKWEWEKAFTLGKAYNVVDGRLKDDGDFTWTNNNKTFHSVDEVNEYFSNAGVLLKFAPFTEADK